MLRLVLLLSLAAAIPAAAGEAEVSCAARAVAALREGVELDAETRCERSSGGEPVPFQQSAAGELTVRDADGDTLYGHTDSFGTTTFRPDLTPTIRPPRLEATPDGLGGAVFRDESGVYHPLTDGQGNSTFYTNDGRIMRCHTDDFGNTACD